MLHREPEHRLSFFSIFSLAILLLAETAFAQDIFIYPAKGQSQAQQDKDRYECHSWAVQQTGFDPSKPQTSAANSDTSQTYKPSQPHVLRGAARGAALGAVGGAITGNAGKGAGAGAAMGGVAGGFRRRDERRDQSNQQAANANNAATSQRTSYNRAMTACLQGRGYTVN
jgi:Glycine-zipper domain